MRLLLIVLLSLTSLLGGEKVLPEGWKFEVGVRGGEGKHQISERLKLYGKMRFEGGKPGCEEELVVNYLKTPDKLKRVNQVTLHADEVLKAFRAASQGEDYQAEKDLKGEKVKYASYPAEGGYSVRLTLDGKIEEFTPGEVKEFWEIRKMMDAAKAWYEKLVVAEALPEWTPGARPPLQRNTAIKIPCGEVKLDAMGIEYELRFMSGLEYGFYWMARTVTFGEKHKASANNARYLDLMILDVGNRLDNGNEIERELKSESSHAKFFLKGNLKDQCVELLCVPNEGKAVKARITVEQVELLRQIVERKDKRTEWLNKHRHLFYEWQRRPICDDTAFNIEMRISRAQSKQPGPLVLRVFREKDTLSREMSPLQVELRWAMFQPGFAAIDRDLLAELCLACEAAAAKKKYIKMIGSETVLQSTEQQGQWVVKLRHHDKRLTLDSAQLGDLKWALQQANEVYDWYDLLTKSQEIPQATAELHPPVVDEIHMMLEITHLTEGSKNGGRMDFLSRVYRTAQGEIEQKFDLRWNDDEESYLIESGLNDELVKHLKPAMEAVVKGEVYQKLCGKEYEERFFLEVKPSSRDIDLYYYPSGTSDPKYMDLEYNWQNHYPRLRYHMEEEAKWLEKHPEVFFTLKK
ncbi:hypothetical protein Rhal01_02520 [Rubritalea halochordaticola]|uniref:Uncharacterized protein n=2 Tax=Rubritalea halochordaticola TaxID=714537 RepID=A0ABP9V4S1_9BACT